MTAIEIQLEDSWKQRLNGEFDKDYLNQLKNFLLAEKNSKKTIYPNGDEWFAAFNATSFENVKVVIVGQDPYHGPEQAHGLCFSVRPGVKLPPSLQNIFKELNADLGIAKPSHGCLIEWAQQGVLLLNSVLTVEAEKPASHEGRGWELFTDQVIRKLNEERTGLVFLLWGSYAQKKASFVDRNKHLVLSSPHPSPLSAHRGFFGTKPFSKINEYLVLQGKSPIEWSLSKNINLN